MSNVPKRKVHNCLQAYCVHFRSPIAATSAAFSVTKRSTTTRCPSSRDVPGDGLVELDQLFVGGRDDAAGTLRRQRLERRLQPPTHRLRANTDTRQSSLKPATHRLRANTGTQREHSLKPATHRLRANIDTQREPSLKPPAHHLGQIQTHNVSLH